MEWVDSDSEALHALWDRLADFQAADMEAALTYLLKELSTLVAAQHAVWIGLVRLSVPFGSDPARGWRTHVVRPLDSTGTYPELFTKNPEPKGPSERRDAAQGDVAPDAVPGAFRANRLRDLAARKRLEAADIGPIFSLGEDMADAIWVAFPINSQSESRFGFAREAGKPPFSETELDLAAEALRAIKWFHRNLMLSHGLLVAKSMVTTSERKVLQGLLSGESEKEIAAAVELSYNTTHEHVMSIYRKYGVNNRAGLMALWLGKAK